MSMNHTKDQVTLVRVLYEHILSHTRDAQVLRHAGELSHHFCRLNFWACHPGPWHMSDQWTSLHLAWKRAGSERLFSL